MKLKTQEYFLIYTKDHNSFQIYQYSINRAYLFHIHLACEVHQLLMALLSFSNIFPANFMYLFDL
jgi:hypothetical protein